MASERYQTLERALQVALSPVNIEPDLSANFAVLDLVSVGKDARRFVTFAAQYLYRRISQLTDFHSVFLAIELLHILLANLDPIHATAFCGLTADLTTLARGGPRIPTKLTERVRELLFQWGSESHLAVTFQPCFTDLSALSIDLSAGMGAFSECSESQGSTCDPSDCHIDVREAHVTIARVESLLKDRSRGAETEVQALLPVLLSISELLPAELTRLSQSSQKHTDLLDSLTNLKEHIDSIVDRVREVYPSLPSLALDSSPSPVDNPLQPPSFHSESVDLLGIHGKLDQRARSPGKSSQQPTDVMELFNMLPSLPVSLNLPTVSPPSPDVSEQLETAELHLFPL